MFARIQNGAVAELFSPPPGATIAECFNAALVWVDTSVVSPQPLAGWTATEAAGVWTFAPPPPPPPPAPVTTMTPLAFISRFTAAEQTAIATAAMGNVALWLWFNRLTAATYVDLTDPETINGLAALVASGLLTSDRQSAILTP